MPQQGTYTAYRQLKPLEGDVSQDIQQQEENGFRRRAEQRQVEQIEQQKVDKAAKQKQDLWEKYVKPLSNYDSGSKSLNEINGRLLLDAQKEYVPLMAVINNPNASDEDRLKATLKLDNINKLPDNLLAMTKSLTERDLTVKKGVAEGKLFDNPDYNKNFQEGYSNKLLALDENGMPMIAFKNPDGTTGLETYDHIQKGVQDYNFQQRFDRDTELLEASKKLLPVVNQTDDGFQKVKTTAVDPTLLSNYVSNQLFESDGVTPSAKLKSFAREAGVKLDDAKGLQRLSKQFENDIRLRIKGGTEVTRNDSALDYQKEKRLSKEPKEESSKTLGAENINKVGIVKGNQMIKGTAIEKANGAKVYSVEGTNLERSIGKKGAYERVQNIYVMPNGKDIVLDVDRVDGTIGGVDGEAKTSNTVKVSYSSNKNAQIIADFVTKKINPKTNKLYKTTREFMSDALGIKVRETGAKPKPIQFDAEGNIIM